MKERPIRGITELHHTFPRRVGYIIKFKEEVIEKSFVEGVGVGVAVIDTLKVRENGHYGHRPGIKVLHKAFLQAVSRSQISFHPQHAR